MLVLYIRRMVGLKYHELVQEIVISERDDKILTRLQK